jgi:cell wall-associated NlpC family hydrolase
MLRAGGIALTILAASLWNPGTAKAQTHAEAAVLTSRAPLEAFSASAAALRDSVVALARAQVGTRYVLGGTTPKGFDCSGLIRFVMAKLNIDLPRTANQQARVGDEVPKSLDELRPGDLLTFGSSRNVSHIGIYIGDGKFVHASSVAGKVVERTFNPQLRGQKPWVGVRRMLSTADVLALASSAAEERGEGQK